MTSEERSEPIHFPPGFLKIKMLVLGIQLPYWGKPRHITPRLLPSILVELPVLCEMSHFGWEFCFNLVILPIPASWLYFFLFISPKRSSICKVSSCNPPSKHCCYWLLYFFVSKSLSCPKEYKENNLHNILSEFFPSLIPQIRKTDKKREKIPT